MEFSTFCGVFLGVLYHANQVFDFVSDFVNALNIIESLFNILSFLNFEIRGSTHLFILDLANNLEEKVEK